ncbi:MAG: WD40 repeat domain-containing protein, partial [Caldilineales bacterium]|nr:WD40 repeat domain-containing protein [Caldilineales bacterium]
EDLSQDQRVKRLFDLRNGNELFAASPLGRVVAVSPDGAFVALHDAKLQKVVIAETKSEQQITSLDVTGAIGEVVFSLDNRLVAIKDETGVDVWDIRDHRHLWQLGGESLGVFSPDGQYILTSVHDDPRLRPTDPERLLTLSAPLIQRDPLALTPEELQRYGLD